MENLNRLNKYIDRRFDERDRMNRRLKAEKIEIIKDRQQKYFWCNFCNKEYSVIGRKRQGLHNSQWWVGRCVCGKNNIRRNGDLDKYFYKSKFLRRERVKHFYDTISPSHPMFDIFYGKQK